MTISTSSTIYWGTNILELDYVKVTILNDDNNDNNNHVSPSRQPPNPAFVKLQLIKLTLQSILLNNNSNNNSKNIINNNNDKQQQQQQVVLLQYDNNDNNIKAKNVHNNSNNNSNNSNNCKSSSNNTNNNNFIISGPLFVRSNNDNNKNNNTIDNNIFHFPSQDPSIVDLCRCQCTGYVFYEHYNLIKQQQQLFRVHVTNKTLVQIVMLGTEDDNTNNNNIICNDQYLTGEIPVLQLHNIYNNNNCTTATTRTTTTTKVSLDDHYDVESVYKTHNPSTIHELTIRIQRLILHNVKVGTTYDALTLQQQQKQQQQQQQKNKLQTIRSSIKRHCNHYHNINNNNKDLKATNYDTTTINETNESSSSSSSSSTTFLIPDGILLIHSPDHGYGKTVLIKTIAQQHGMIVHCIRPSALLAKYGIYADTAIQCIIHTATINAAIQQQQLCIILDELDVMTAISANNNNSNNDTSSSTATKQLSLNGDAATPALYGIQSYIRTLILSLQQRQEIPFPSNNPLYNINGTGGSVVNVSICIIAIVTCSDNDHNILSSITNNRYRIPNLTSSTRLDAFSYAFLKEKVQLTTDLDDKLSRLAASAIWARGIAFRRIAKILRTTVLTKKLQKSEQNYKQSTNDDDVVIVSSMQDLENVFTRYNSRSTKATNTATANVQFLADDNIKEQNNDANNKLFNAVGGNDEAKMALQDALALDPGRRHLLQSLGVTPPNGLLLYGPPGTGKTLLAKAVARILNNSNNNNESHASNMANIGGAFIAISSTDIVQAEVGSGEKILVTAFQTARMNSPAVIFIDEFQALFTDRSSRGGTGRLTTTLLQCMDDIKRWGDVDRQAMLTSHNQIDNDDNEDNTNRSRVLVLAATNTPWMIDKAFLRPGRFDRAIFVDLPNIEERQAILEIHIGRMKAKFEHGLDVLCTELAKRTDGYSGADIAALCRAAAVQCLMDESSSVVMEKHFYDVLYEGFESSCTTSLVEEIRNWRH